MQEQKWADTNKYFGDDTRSPENQHFSSPPLLLTAYHGHGSEGMEAVYLIRRSLGGNMMGYLFGAEVALEINNGMGKGAMANGYTRRISTIIFTGGRLTRELKFFYQPGLVSDEKL